MVFLNDLPQRTPQGKDFFIMPKLAYFRHYEEIFSLRRPQGQVIEEDQPEWAYQ